MDAGRSSNVRTAVSVTILLLLTEAVYLPLSVLRGKSLFGWDYMMLHLRRLAFARESLLGSAHTLPAWFPREVLGTPFSANLQSFPWIPTHWILLAFDPERAYPVAIALAAGLTAVFTYAYCRQIGLTQVASIAAGWTFACAGFFAARIEVGHLTLLEAYPGLPLLLLVVERAIDPELAPARHFHLAIVAVVSACLAVTGHPQLPAYSFAAAILYALWRARGRVRARALAAMILGASASAVIWWPTIQLIRRSTRMLALAPASNDIVLPYRRLLALFIPGIDGWPAGVSLSVGHPFTGYPHPGYFWDTVAYTGILPWIAAMGLALRCLVQKRLPSPRWTFFAMLGCGALLAALPLFTPLRDVVRATLLRSPSRLLYLSTFCLAMALGAAVDAVLRSKPMGRSILTYLALALCLALHGRDLGRFARLFLVPVERHEMEDPEIDRIVARDGPDSRIAVSPQLAMALSSRYDDAGGFDSILLADSYRAFLALTGSPTGRNEEVIDASLWPVNALRMAGVHFVITPEKRSDLELLTSVVGLQVYHVNNAAPRVAFENTCSGAWSRPSSDEIVIRVTQCRAGSLSLLEAYDPGWRAEADGAPVPVRKANGLGMAVPIPAGTHSVRFRYRTPGRTMGAAITLCSLILLAGLIRRSATSPTPPAAESSHSPSPPTRRRAPAS